MVPDAALDPRVIESLRQLTPPGEPDVLAQILTVFLEEVPKKIRALQVALDAGDAAAAARAAHSLKGSSGNVGASALLDICRRVDERARSGDMAQIAPLLPSLMSEYHRVELEVRRLLQTS